MSTKLVITAELKVDFQNRKYYVYDSDGCCMLKATSLSKVKTDVAQVIEDALGIKVTTTTRTHTPINDEPLKHEGKHL